MAAAVDVVGMLLNFTILPELAAELQGELREAVIAFYSTDLGGRIVDLENSARRAIGDWTRPPWNARDDPQTART